MRQITGKELLEFGLVQIFLKALGVTADPFGDVGTFLQDLWKADPRSRSTQDIPRHMLEQSTATVAATVESATMALAEFFRMTDESETPLVGDYDLLIAPTGSARQAPRQRARHAVDAILRGDATAGIIVGVGSSRRLNEKEQLDVENYAPGALIELDLVAAASREIATALPKTVVATCFVDNERAGNDDILSAVIEGVRRFSQPPYPISIAAVTTQIYRWSLDLDLRRIAARYGIGRTFVAGNASNREVIAKRSLETYITENLRNIRAARLAAAAGV